MRSLISAKLDKQNTFQPNIQGNIAEKTHDPHVHDRLYEDFRKRSTKENITNQSVDKLGDSKKKSKRKLETYSRNPGSSISSSSTKLQKENIPIAT